MTAISSRWGSVLALMVIAPWMAEMSWGGYPFTDIPLIVVFLGPMYGGAAVLIREVARRTGRGWPTVLLMAAAFGVLQAGIVDQSLFNPAYGRYDFQHPVHIGGLDISLYYLVAFVTGHIVASIALPIVIAESWSRHPKQPWLSRRGMWAVAVLYVLATLINHIGVKDEDGHGFQASGLQTVTAAGVVMTLAVVALLWYRRPLLDGWVPPAPVLAAGAFVAYLLYLPGENGAALAVGIVVIVSVAAGVGHWSRHTAWTDGRTYALAMGALLTGVIMPFWSEPYDVSVSDRAQQLGDAGAAAICLAIAGLTTLRRHVVRGTTVTGGL